MRRERVRPSPAQVGLPASYKEWRPKQYAAMWRAVESRKRFKCFVMPTGFGKTITYMAAGLLQEHRLAVLTSTKPHQDQLITDLSSIGLVDVRGAGNYPCLMVTDEDRARRTPRMCDNGHCRAGIACSLKMSGCTYFDAYRRALGSQLVVTNYSYWLAQSAYGEGLGHVDTLVLDEAHDAPNQLSDFLGVTIPEIDLSLYGIGYPSARDWRPWVDESLRKLAFHEGIANGVDNVVAVKRLKSSLERLRLGAAEDWVMEHLGRALRWDIVWPAAYAERYLFCSMDSIILVSATLRKKTLDLLGIPKDQYEWIEYGSSFEADRRPIYFIPTVKVHRKNTPQELAKWKGRINEIVEARKDRKGIVHTVSYNHRDTILADSPHKSRMHSHRRGDLQETIQRFRQSPAGVLISPSVTTGYDFPYDACEYQVIAKIPFPDSSSRIVNVRTQADKDYGIYLAVQTLVQAVGRGMRAADDRCECFVIDDNVYWLYSRYASYFPRWFKDAVVRRYTIPEAPPRVEKRALLPAPLQPQSSTSLTLSQVAEVLTRTQHPS